MAAEKLSKAERNREAILDAATYIIKSQGFGQISMDAVATRAGLSRRTLYRTFGSRDELLAALMFHQSFPKIDELVFANGSFRDVLIETAAMAISLIQRDPIMMEMIYGGGASWYQKQMLDYESPVFRCVFDINMGFWKQHLERGRREGAVNPALTDDEIMTWYTAIQYMMITRVKATVEEHRDLMSKFFLPSIRP